MKNFLGLLLIALLLIILTASFLMPQSRPAHATTISPLHVSGNQLIDASGTPVILRGVNRSGTEYACIQGWGIFDGPNVMNDDSQVPLMKSWGVNEVNLGINEDCWLNINGVPAAYGGANYINAIKHEVATLEASGIYPVINMFWEAAGATRATNQSAMPDNDHAPAAWQSIANTFKNDPSVILRLKEEPYPAGNTWGASAWDCWSHGDRQYNTSNTLVPVSSVKHCSEGYPVVGMQSLINIVRGTGSTNIIQVPGVAYSDELNSFLNPAYRVSDTLSSPQLMAVVDVYPETHVNVCGTLTCYNSDYLPVMQQMPLIAGEIGEDVNGSSSSTAQVDVLMNWLDQNGGGYAAWAWDTWGGTLQLITSYTTGAPKGNWGNDYKNHLLSLVGPPVPTPTPTPPSSNLLVNGSFDSGSLSPWVLRVISPAAGSAAISTSIFVDGTASAKVKVSKANSNAWYVQFSQRGISMVAGHTYTLTFYIKASVSRKVNVLVQESSSPRTTYMRHIFSVSTVWAKNTVTFTPSVSDIVVVNFNLAQYTGAVYIDAVSLW